MKVSRNKLIGMIKESITKCMSCSYAHSTYVPYERNIFSEEEVENAPEELDEILNNKYDIIFSGNSWSEPSDYVYPGGSGVDDISLNDDGGFSSDLQILANNYPEFAQRLKNDFDNWCNEQGENSLDFEDDYGDYSEPDWDD